MTLDKLKEAMPDIAKTLGEMMVEHGIGAFQACGMTLDDAMPSVAVTYRPKDGGKAIKVSLSIEDPDDDEEDED